MSNKRGQLVVVEGVDGSGKSSVISSLCNWLNRETTTITRMPGGSPFAEEHRSACRSADIDEGSQLLFYSALNRDASISAIKPELEKGKNVICDRGWVSTLVYQALPSNQEKLLLKIVEDPQIPMPDLMIYLDIPLSVSIEREQARSVPGVNEINDDRYSQFELTKKEKIKEGYDIFFKLPAATDHYCENSNDPKTITKADSFAVMWKFRHRLAKNIAIINANRPFNEVLESVKSIIEAYLQPK